MTENNNKKVFEFEFGYDFDYSIMKRFFSYWLVAELSCKGIIKDLDDLIGNTIILIFPQPSWEWETIDNKIVPLVPTYFQGLLLKEVLLLQNNHDVTVKIKTIVKDPTN